MRTFAILFLLAVAGFLGTMFYKGNVAQPDAPTWTVEQEARRICGNDRGCYDARILAETVRRVRP